MTNKELDNLIREAMKMEERLKTVHEMTPVKWIIGWDIVSALKASHLAGNTIDDHTFIGIPYLLDYKDKGTLLIATDPLN